MQYLSYIVWCGFNHHSTQALHHKLCLSTFFSSYITYPNTFHNPKYLKSITYLDAHKAVNQHRDISNSSPLEGKYDRPIERKKESILHTYCVGNRKWPINLWHSITKYTFEPSTHPKWKRRESKKNYNVCVHIYIHIPLRIYLRISHFQP